MQLQVLEIDRGQVNIPLIPDSGGKRGRRGWGNLKLEDIKV